MGSHQGYGENELADDLRTTSIDRSRIVVPENRVNSGGRDRRKPSEQKAICIELKIGCEA